MTRYRFSAPPNWPAPPEPTWAPSPAWHPDPSWPDAPLGWEFWTPVADGEVGASEPLWRYRVSGHSPRWQLRVNLVLLTAVLVLLVGAATWTVTTSALGHPIFAQGEFTIFFAPPFFLGLAAFAPLGSSTRRRFGQPRRPGGSRTGPLGRRGKILTGVGAAAAATVLFASLASGSLVPPGGQPEYDSAHHRYVLDDHGSLTTISKAAYEHGSVAGGHLFTVFASVLLLIELVVLARTRSYWQHALAGTPISTTLRYDRVEWAEGQAVVPPGVSWHAQLRLDADGVELRRVPGRLYKFFVEAQGAMPSPAEWSRPWADIEFVHHDGATLHFGLRAGGEMTFTARRARDISPLTHFLGELRIPAR